MTKAADARLEIVYRPIGCIHSPFQRLEDMPIQPSGEASAAGSVEVFAEFAPGLRDLEGFSHIVLIYHLHAVRRVDLTVIPFLDSQPHGVFATRAPTRPNPIGLSVVRLLRIEGNWLHVEHLDVLDSTPLLDIKPYVSEFDAQTQVRIGWLEAARGRAHTTTSDSRFE